MFYSVLLTSLILPLAASQNLLPRQTSSVTGDRQCGQTMCVSAKVNGTQVEYVLASTGRANVGWMGVGFGQQMVNTPMVIMWANSDGTITLSQRSAPDHVMPTVDRNPPRIASRSLSPSSSSNNNTHFAFTVPANGNTVQPVIYAFGTTNPNSAAVDATLEQHLDAGVTQLDLTRPLTGQMDDTTGPSSPSSSSSNDIPLLPYQRMLIAHAICCIIGFLLLLPAGALLARYLRTFTPTWFTGHWIAQFALAGPLIVAGFALGIQAVNEAGAPHLGVTHQRMGVSIFVLYVVQCSLGAVIHWVKPKNTQHRPPQNYFHAILGILIIALALYQVRTGYKVEWPRATGRGALPRGSDIVYWIWVAVLPIAYGAGLLFLRRQFKQEDQARYPQNKDNIDRGS